MLRQSFQKGIVDNTSGDIGGQHVGIAGSSEQEIGLRIARLAAQVYTSPNLPFSAYEDLVAMMEVNSPGSMGSLNHHRNFCRNFGRVMLAHLRLCLALQHWAQVV